MQCLADWRRVGEDVCKAAAEAYQRRFFSGRSGPEEYDSLEELPPIPPTFDSPVDDEVGPEAQSAVASEITQ